MAHEHPTGPIRLKEIRIMRAVHMSGSVRAKIAAVAAVGVCVVTAAAPAALALNPQPLPPRAAKPAAPAPLIGGFLTCHEYGCL